MQEIFGIFAGKPWNNETHPDYAPCINLPDNHQEEDRAKASSELNRYFFVYFFAVCITECSLPNIVTPATLSM